MARKTIKDLEEQIRGLEPYREAVTCFMRGDVPITLTSEERSIDVLGLSRASGGVIVRVNGEPCAVMWIGDWTAKWGQSNADPYMRDLAHKALRAQKEAIEKSLNDREACTSHA